MLDRQQHHAQQGTDPDQRRQRAAGDLGPDLVQLRSRVEPQRHLAVVGPADHDAPAVQIHGESDQRLEPGRGSERDGCAIHANRVAARRRPLDAFDITVACECAQELGHAGVVAEDRRAGQRDDQRRQLVLQAFRVLRGSPVDLCLDEADDQHGAQHRQHRAARDRKTRHQAQLSPRAHDHRSSAFSTLARRKVRALS
jgi:hypothetical protein